MQGAIGIRAGRHMHDDAGHLGVQSRDAQALLATHADPGGDERLAVPIRSAREVLHRAVVGEIHLQKIVLITIVAADRLILLQFLAVTRRSTPCG